jgi:hypothetical protein
MDMCKTKKSKSESESERDKEINEKKKCAKNWKIAENASSTIISFIKKFPNPFFSINLI